MILPIRRLLIALLLGAFGAFLFALILQLTPSWILLSASALFLYHAFTALVGVALLEIVRQFLKSSGPDTFYVVMAMLCGGALFDGTCIAFFPGVYGQTGEALTRAATVLLMGFGTFGVAAFLRLDANA